MATITIDGEYIPYGPQCARCAHLRDPDRHTCAAFPAAKAPIPREIWNGQYDHRQPYPGDNGIQFEPREGVAV